MHGRAHIAVFFWDKFFFWDAVFFWDVVLNMIHIFCDHLPWSSGKRVKVAEKFERRVEKRGSETNRFLKDLLCVLVCECHVCACVHSEEPLSVGV